MTIMAGLTILVGLLAAAVLFSQGVPETMRSVALWLLVHARRIDTWRAAADAVTRQALEAETR